MLKKINGWMLKIMRGQWRNILFTMLSKFGFIDLDNVSTQSLGLSSKISCNYHDSGDQDLDFVLNRLPIKPTDCIIDMGCGKCGAIITFYSFPFKHIDGVDISQTLLIIASRNLNRVFCNRTKLFLCNASSFTDMDIYTHIYMYNPFPCNVMKDVMGNIKSSLHRKPRRMTIIYKNPICHEIIVGEGGFGMTQEFCHSTHPFWIYENRWKPAAHRLVGAS